MSNAYDGNAGYSHNPLPVLFKTDADMEQELMRTWKTTAEHTSCKRTNA